MNHEKFHEYVGERSIAHAADIRARLAAGDAETVAQIETAVSALLFSSADWADLIQRTALGCNAFAVIMTKAIEAEAEVLALKDAEAAEQDDRAEFIEPDAPIFAPAHGPWLSAGRL